MSKLTTVLGDATKPIRTNDRPIIIPHIVNTMNCWGAGFVLAITKTLGAKPHDEYRRWAAKLCEPAFILGNVQFVTLDNNIVVANMLAQDGFNNGRAPIRYGALVYCMNQVADYTLGAGGEIHCPMFGAGLAGGNWSALEDIIREIWIDYNIDVTVYKFQ